MVAKRGRPSRYSPHLAKAICQRLAAGETLRAICRDAGMPPERTVRGWALDDVEGFGPHYARAREIGYATLADEILEIADDSLRDTIPGVDGAPDRPNSEWINRSRLRVDTRKWLLAKALPKIYGDKLEVGGKDGGPIQLQHMIDRPPNETREQWIERRKKELADALGAAGGAAK